ncbi:MAG: hypothetical protein A3G25_10745 [Betaproteobacteria bacterium RIFCSPLOWO2_12_FULL_63_13]|nr:MAG: hypothetical protein A3G25_10745 [Betaproteobacteria bacterium RIFCSPLOWO2_12_FULL_63_13]
MLALQLQLDQSQWWPAAMIEKRQFEQLHGVLAHAQRNVPFHGPRLAAAGFDPRVPLDRDLWSRIPVMTRREVQLNRDALASRSIPPEHGAVREITTSGSTGRAITVLATEVHAIIWQAITLREHLWHRRDLAAKLAVIRSRSGGTAEYPAGRIEPGWGPSTDVAYRTGECAILNTSCTTAEQAEWLARQDPDYLLTTATRARELARLFRRSGQVLRRLREVRTYGEALADDLREQCRDTWGVPVVDMYSAEEIGYIALQCPEREHYHVQSENVLVEFLDDLGRPCRAGEIGRVVISSLHNFATPLIRYEIGDYAEVGAVCPCGRGLPVLKRIMGRVRNMLRMPDGNTRWPNFMLAKTRSDLPVAQIQIVQTALDTLELRVLPEQPLSSQERGRLLDYVRDWAGPQFKVQLRIVDAIPRGAGGKFEEFLSELPQ